MKEIGRFVFGIRLFLHADDKLGLEVQNVNHNVPGEIIIQNMKEFLQRMEKDFSERFGATFGQGKQ